jgi:hypothetical protein
MLYNKHWDFPVTPYGVLEKAGGIMNQYGLAKNRMLAEDGSVCIHGAVMLAVHGTVDEGYFNPLYLGALRVLADHLKMPWGDLAAWSNRPERSKDEVVNAFFGASLALQMADQT